MTQGSTKMIRTTLHTEFSTGKGVALGGTRGNTTLDRQGLIIRILILEDTSMGVVPDSFHVLEFILLE